MKFFIFLVLSAVSVQGLKAEEPFFKWPAAQNNSSHLVEFFSWKQKSSALKQASKKDIQGSWISSLRYSFVFSSLFNNDIKKYFGKWHIAANLSWIHDVDISKNTSNKRFMPFLSSLGARWELSYLPYIKPLLGWHLVWANPFKHKGYTRQNYFGLASSAKNKFHLFTLGCLFSFDLLDSNFSTRMESEYKIYDMGLLVEYQRYILAKGSFSRPHRQGVVFGLFFFL